MVIALIGGLLAITALVLGGIAYRHGATGAPTPTPTVDPRLILHARSVPVTGTLGGAAVKGTLYPALPGRNTLRLTVHGLDVARSSPLRLTATMPGMRMPPATATLQAVRDTYGGSISLPMFGVYVADLSLGGSNGVLHGTVRITVPLDLGH